MKGSEKDAAESSNTRNCAINRMTSLPDNSGPNEHIAMPLIIYHNVDNFFYLSFVVAVLLFL